MMAGRYTLLDQSAVDDLLPLALERGVGVVAAGVYNSGLLAGRGPGRRPLRVSSGSAEPSRGHARSPRSAIDTA